MSPSRGLILAVLALAALGAVGCQEFAWILTNTIGPFVPEDKVEAQYSLKGKSVLILVDTKDATLASEYPRIEVTLADAISKCLATAKACGPIVSSHSVEAARRSEPGFREWSVEEVGKYFNVDLVIHLELFTFRVKDDPGANLFHGYAEASVRVVAPETGDQVWPVLAAARVINAETVQGTEPEREDQQEPNLVEGFADKIARLFYTYKKDDLPIRPKVK